MKCPKCGKELDDESIFCNYCGSNIQEITDQNDINKKNQEGFTSNGINKTNKTEYKASVYPLYFWVDLLANILLVLGIIGSFVLANTSPLSMYGYESVGFSTTTFLTSIFSVSISFLLLKSVSKHLHNQEIIINLLKNK